MVRKINYLHIFGLIFIVFVFMLQVIIWDWHIYNILPFCRWNVFSISRVPQPNPMFTTNTLSGNSLLKNFFSTSGSILPSYFIQFLHFNTKEQRILNYGKEEDYDCLQNQRVLVWYKILQAYLAYTTPYNTYQFSTARIFG